MIVVRELSKCFRRGRELVPALREVNLNVEAGKFFVLLGPSGSGKTTLLRCVAGLEKPDQGELAIGERTVFSRQQNLFVSPEDRGVGMVFQSYAIWPHLTVYENVALPLRRGRRKIPQSEVPQRVERALRLLQMEKMKDSPAPLLSGGQQQRVALARALALNPAVLLMDEPLSNLDARLREEIRSEIWELAKSLRITVLYVTHDQVEAMAIADQIAVMHEGRVLQVGSPLELYRNPQSQIVAEFFGSMNWIEGELVEGGKVRSEIGVLNLKVPPTIFHELVLGCRFEDVQINDGAADRSDRGGTFQGRVVRKVFLGDFTLYDVEVEERRKIHVKAYGHGDWSGTVTLTVPREKLVIFPRQRQTG